VQLTERDNQIKFMKLKIKNNEEKICEYVEGRNFDNKIINKLNNTIFDLKKESRNKDT